MLYSNMVGMKVRAPETKKNATEKKTAADHLPKAHTSRSTGASELVKHTAEEEKQGCQQQRQAHSQCSCRHRHDQKITIN